VTTLEALQRRSSDIWEQYREQLAAHPDAIELPRAFAEHGWVRVAVGAGGMPVGFSAVIPSESGTHELDGLFVEPGEMRHGVGRALIEDAAARARAAGAIRLEVTVGPARPFYERVGFTVTGSTQTRFGPTHASQWIAAATRRALSSSHHRTGGLRRVCAGCQVHRRKL
jgi:GNAT superfamily N-acetyltransferase